VKIQVTKSSAPLRITQDLVDTAVISGGTVTFTVGVSDPNGATYQWMLNGNAINGATSASYTTPALTAANNGAKYSVRVVGPGGSATSREAVVSVVDALTISNPKFSVDFNDGTLPENATITGTAALPGDGALHLTDAVNGQGGTIVVTNVDTGAVSGFTLHAKLLVGGVAHLPRTASASFGATMSHRSDIRRRRRGLRPRHLLRHLRQTATKTPPAPSIDARWQGALAGTVSHALPADRNRDRLHRSLRPR
jgi:hypothetical protein